jgi:hypothetical protein
LVGDTDYLILLAEKPSAELKSGVCGTKRGDEYL